MTDTLLLVNVIAVDVVLLALGAATAVAYRRLRPRPDNITVPPYATFERQEDDAHFDLDAFAAPRPGGEKDPW